MIIVTGGAGLIGAHLVRALNKRGRDDIIVVDDLRDGRKFANLLDAHIQDFLDRDEFLALLRAPGAGLPVVDAIFHQGACTVTTEWDGRYMMENNYRYSRVVLDFALRRRCPFYYASSAAVYGVNRSFAEQEDNERPVNVYGYSKYLFDCHVRCVLRDAKDPVAGLRYFNVYGPGEAHKGKMSSLVLQQYQQLRDTGVVKLFAGSGGFTAGEQRRDFIHVRDVVAINLWLFERGISGIFNAGTGTSSSFNELAQAAITEYGAGRIEYVPFPSDLRDSYQSFTKACLSRLRAAGYQGEFIGMREGVRDYMRHLTR